MTILVLWILAAANALPRGKATERPGGSLRITPVRITLVNCCGNSCGIYLPRRKLTIRVTSAHHAGAWAGSRRKFGLRSHGMKKFALLSVVCTLACVCGCTVERTAAKTQSGAAMVNSTAKVAAATSTTKAAAPNSTSNGSAAANAAGLQCKRSRVTGTLIDVRVCTTAAEREATAVDTQATRDALRGPHAGPCVGLGCST